MPGGATTISKDRGECFAPWFLFLLLRSCDPITSKIPPWGAENSPNDTSCKDKSSNVQIVFKASFQYNYEAYDTYWNAISPNYFKILSNLIWFSKTLSKLLMIFKPEIHARRATMIFKDRGEYFAPLFLSLLLRSCAPITSKITLWSVRKQPKWHKLQRQIIKCSNFFEGEFSI